MTKEELAKTVRGSDLKFRESFQHGGEISSLDIQKSPSYGENLVGLNFNPSQKTEVDTVKQLSAQLIDIVKKVEDDSVEHGTLNSTRQLLINNAVLKVLDAQMSVVKLLTFK